MTTRHPCRDKRGRADTCFATPDPRSSGFTPGLCLPHTHTHNLPGSGLTRVLPPPATKLAGFKLTRVLPPQTHNPQGSELTRVLRPPLESGLPSSGLTRALRLAPPDTQPAGPRSRGSAPAPARGLQPGASLVPGTLLRGRGAAAAPACLPLPAKGRHAWSQPGRTWGRGRSRGLTLMMLLRRGVARAASRRLASGSAAAPGRETPLLRSRRRPPAPAASGEPSAASSRPPPPSSAIASRLQQRPGAAAAAGAAAPGSRRRRRLRGSSGGCGGCMAGRRCAAGAGNAEHSPDPTGRPH